MNLVAGPWLPDQPALGNPGLVVAQNCIPASGHYLPFPSATALGLDGLSGQAEGMTVATPATGSPVQFVGVNGHLWRIPSATAAPGDVSQDPIYGYTMLPGDRWRWTQYGQLQLATNLNDTVQSFDLSNLAGTFVDLTNAPKAKYITRVRDFVVLGHVNEAPDGEIPYRLRWHGYNTSSGLPDETEWTISLDTRSDFQDVADIGEMTGLTGGGFGIALFRRGIARLDFGGQFLFDVPVVDQTIGCEVPGSVVQYGAETYFWSDEGIFKTAGGPAVPVGSERVNRYLRENFDLSQPDEVWAWPDYSKGIIAWVYPTVGDTKSMLIYRLGVDQFSTVDIGDLDALGPAVGFGLDLDDPYEFEDLDTDPRDLDDPRLWGSGLLKLGGMLEDEYGTDMVVFDGPALGATLEWAEMEPGEGQRFALTSAMAFHERGTPSLTILSRERPGDDLVIRGPYSSQNDGWFRFRALGRFHRARMMMSDDWQTARGLDVLGAPLGWR